MTNQSKIKSNENNQSHMKVNSTPYTKKLMKTNLLSQHLTNVFNTHGNTGVPKIIDPLLNKPETNGTFGQFKLRKVKEDISRLNNRRAPGPDQLLGVEMLEEFPIKGVIMLLHILNYIHK